MKLNVLLISNQVRGIDATGGLGDVVSGLAKTLAKKEGLDIRVLKPGYQKVFGLTQLISMRYGAGPIVRFTGGLVDTVVNEAAGPAGCGFGFKEAVFDRFATADIPRAAEYLYTTVKRALDVFTNNPKRWAELTKVGMATDSSWEIPATQYVKIYHEAVRRRVGTHFLLK